MILKLGELLDEDHLMDQKSLIKLFMLVIVVSGVFGFIYETLFYRIDLGYFVKRGTTFGPWIPIYGFGGLFITLFTYRFRKNSWFVFFLSCIICGILEFMTGYLLFHMSGTRLWDYNTEIWNFGNVGGYICFRSILFFGISGVFLIYFIIPLCKKIIFYGSNSIFGLIGVYLGILFFLDVVISDFIPVIFKYL